MSHPQTMLLNAFLLLTLVSPAASFGYINAGFRSQKEYDRYRAEEQSKRDPQRQRDAEQLAVINSAIQRDPDDLVALYQRGKFFYQHSSYEKAMADFNAVIERDPNFARAYFHRSVLWDCRAHEPSHKRLADLDETIRLEPTFIFAHAERAKLLFDGPDSKLRNLEEALKAARTACDLAIKLRATWKPNETSLTRNDDVVYHAHLCGLLGAILVAQGDFDAAIECEIHSVQLMRGQPPTTLNVFYLTHHEEKISEYRKRKADSEKSEPRLCFRLRAS